MEARKPTYFGTVIDYQKVIDKDPNHAPCSKILKPSYTNIQDLPPEIICKILNFLPTQEQKNFISCSKHLFEHRNLIKDRTLNYNKYKKSHINRDVYDYFQIIEIYEIPDYNEVIKLFPNKKIHLNLYNNNIANLTPTQILNKPHTPLSLREQYHRHNLTQNLNKPHIP